MELPPLYLDVSNDPIAMMVAASVIGFFRIRDAQGNVQGPECIGSGTLVRMPGNKRGVLTAAHVLDVIPKRGVVGYLTFTRPESIQQSRIEVELTEKVYAPGWRREEDVLPDLGFLHIIQPDVLATIEARGCSFYDLERKREIRGITDNLLAYENYVTGVVGESKQVMPNAEDVPRRTGFTAMVGHCESIGHIESGGFTIISAEIGVDRPPASYGGVSGGGFWLVTAPGGRPKEWQRFLSGVVFCQSDAREDGNRILHCHSILDVERLLISQFPK